MTEPSPVVCPNCEAPAVVGSSFCTTCGTALPQPPTGTQTTVGAGGPGADTTPQAPPTEAIGVTPPASSDAWSAGDMPPFNQSAPAPPMPDEQRPDDAAPRAWWIIGGIAVALIIAGIAAFLLLGDDQSVTTDDVAPEPGATETSLSTTTAQPATTEPPTDDDTEPTPPPTTDGSSATTAPRQAPTTESSPVTTATPTSAPATTAPEATPTDRSEEAAGLVGEAIEDCGGLGFVDTIVGSPTGDDSVYKVKSRFVRDDSDPFTATYTVDVDSESITPGDSESAYLACQ